MLAVRAPHAFLRRLCALRSARSAASSGGAAAPGTGTADAAEVRYTRDTNDNIVKQTIRCAVATTRARARADGAGARSPTGEVKEHVAPSSVDAALRASKGAIRFTRDIKGRLVAEPESRPLITTDRGEPSKPS